MCNEVSLKCTVKRDINCILHTTITNLILAKCIDSRPRVGLDCQKRSRSDLCSKLPDMRLVGDIALNLSLRKIKRE